MLELSDITRLCLLQTFVLPKSGMLLVYFECLFFF